jgi:hypothetical protein
MSESKQFPLKLRFSGKTVEENGVDLYDGSTSFQGFAQAIQIVVHAYLHNEVVSRATAMKGAKVYFGSPRRGSVLFDVVVIAEKYPVVAGFSAAVFYDFVKYSLGKAAGYLSAKPETASIQKLAIDETFFDQLAETLEGSLQRAHRAIDHGVPQITLERPRANLVIFDNATSQWVNTRDENPDIEEMTGSVTRYNSISGNGRAFVRELGKVIPFRPGPKFPDNKRGFLTWSLHGNTVSGQKELRFWGSKIESAKGDPKRLILSDCVEA